jgi:NADH-quinone oxidoreductase subunit A
MAPTSSNPAKFEPYECGIPTKGTTWLQFNVGYYLFAILFLVFDVETVFVFPWAVVMKELGMVAFVEIVIFFFVLVLGLAYAWKKKALVWE